MFASTIGQIGHPFYLAFAWVLAAIYSAIPDYAVAIALLTIAVMVVLFPIMLKGTRGMMKMQLLAPELKKIQERYKAKPGMSIEERQEARRALNEEMMALYRENGTSPTGGCLPQFLQMPMFLILYGTIRGLVHTTPEKIHGVLQQVPTPLYIGHDTRLYQNIVHSGGVLKSFGINMADSVRTASLTWGEKVPFIALILVAIGLQYVQMKQLSGRNPAARQANPQMQQMQKIFPLIFAIIYISIPAGVNVYFIVSSLFRVVAQEVMYRNDPELQAAMAKLRDRHAAAPRVLDAKAVQAGPEARGGRFAKFRAAVTAPAAVPSQPAEDEPGNGKAPGGNGNRPSPRSNQRSTKGRTPPRAARPAQPRAAGKRPRRPR